MFCANDYKLLIHSENLDCGKRISWYMKAANPVILDLVMPKVILNFFSGGDNNHLIIFECM